MAFPNGWGRNQIITINKDDVILTGDVVKTQFLITLDHVNDEVVNAGEYSALNGGGDIRFSRDALGEERLACHILTFVTDSILAKRACAIWVNIPDLSSTEDTEIYIWYDKDGESQPKSYEPYGKDEVWNAGASNWVIATEPGNVWQNQSENKDVWQIDNGNDQFWSIHSEFEITDVKIDYDAGTDISIEWNAGASFATVTLDAPTVTGGIPPYEYEWSAKSGSGLMEYNALDQESITLKYQGDPLQAKHDIAVESWAVSVTDSTKSRYLSNECEVVLDVYRKTEPIWSVAILPTDFASSSIEWDAANGSSNVTLTAPIVDGGYAPFHYSRSSPRRYMIYMRIS